MVAFATSISTKVREFFWKRNKIDVVAFAASISTKVREELSVV